MLLCALQAQSFSCLLCGNVFGDEKRLKWHQHDRHGPLQCEYCPYSVSAQRAGDMKRHAQQYRQIVRDSKRTAVTFPKMRRVGEDKDVLKRKAGGKWTGKAMKGKPAAAGQPGSPEPLLNMPQYVAEEHQLPTLVGVECVSLPPNGPCDVSSTGSRDSDTCTCYHHLFSGFFHPEHP